MNSGTIRLILCAIFLYPESVDFLIFHFIFEKMKKHFVYKDTCYIFRISKFVLSTYKTQ